MPRRNLLIKLSNVLISFCLLLAVAGACQAQFFNLPGNFSSSLKKVFDVSPDGKIAVTLRNAPGASSALLTTFDPVLGTQFDSKTFGLGPLEVHLVETTAGLRAVVLTSQGGPRAITLFSVSSTGQLTELAKSTLTNSSADAGSNLVLSGSAGVGFTLLISNLQIPGELVAFSLIDGAIIGRLQINTSPPDFLGMYEKDGKRTLAYVNNVNNLRLVDASNPTQLTEIGNVVLTRNGEFSGFSSTSFAFSADGRYVFVANQFIDFSVVDVSALKVVASIGGNYRFVRVRKHEDSQRRLLALQSDLAGTGGQRAILLVDASDPLNPSIINRYDYASDALSFRSDMAFSRDGSRLFVAATKKLLAFEIPTFKIVWERQVPGSVVREQQIMTFGQTEEEVLGAWDGSPSGLTSLFGSFPAFPPDISVNDTTATEGDIIPTSASFTVTLSSPTAHRVTLSFTVAGGTAIKDVDFNVDPQIITFEPGETTKNINVWIAGDKLDEFDETFTVILSNPTVGNLLRSVGTGTILDNDPPPTVFITSQVAVTEGNNATATAFIDVSLSMESGKTITVNYATEDNTALAGSDYVATSGSLVFSPGQTTRTINVAVNGDTKNEPNESFFVNLSNPINVTITNAQAIVTIINDDTPTLQLSQGSYSIAEGTGSLNVIVNRSGDPAVALTVNYLTTDSANYLQDCNVINSQATSRCDYVAVVGTLHFAAGETSKTISIPIVDDTYAEGSESFFISLSNPVGGGSTLGAIRSATITVSDNGNDGAGQANPIDNATFFVREHYIDFLSREPDPASAGWLTQLSGCGAGDQSCRLSVSQGIYGSPEFKDRGYFIYKFFSVGLGRKPSYDEFNVDRARVSGFQTDAELEQSKKDFIADFMARAEFANAYNGLSNDAYVQKLFTTAGVTQITVGGVVRTLSTEQQLLAANTISRAQVLRDIAESPEVSAQFLTESTVVMHYFGYLRRDPDAAYQTWITILTTTGDSRNVTNGFINSTEYRARFGQ